MEITHIVYRGSRRYREGIREREKEREREREEENDRTNGPNYR